MSNLSRALLRLAPHAALGGSLAGLTSALAAGTVWRLGSDVSAWTAWSALLLASVELARRHPTWRRRVLVLGSALAPVVFVATLAPGAFAQRYSFLGLVLGGSPPRAGIPTSAEAWAAHWLALGLPCLLLANLRLPRPPGAVRGGTTGWLPPLTLLMVWSSSYAGWEDMIRWYYAGPRAVTPLWEWLLAGSAGQLAAVVTLSVALLVTAAQLAGRGQPGAPAGLQACAVILAGLVLTPATQHHLDDTLGALTSSGPPGVAAILGFDLARRLVRGPDEADVAEVRVQTSTADPKVGCACTKSREVREPLPSRGSGPRRLP